VERHLDDQLGSEEDDVPLPTGLTLEKRARLPLQRLVSEPFERLTEHDKSAALRIASAKMQVAEPAAASSAAPLGREHDKVERTRNLDFQPRTPATSRGVRCVQRLCHQAFVTPIKRLGEKAFSAAGIANDAVRHDAIARK